MIDPRTLCSAAVLAGGKSSRMGQPKPRLDLAGEPLLSRVLRPLAALFDDVFIVSSDASLAEFGVPVWPDVATGGPLAGVLTALEHSERRHCLVVACDMPFLSAPLLRYMTELAGDADVVAPRDERGWHPLHAVYARGVAPVAAERLRRGEGAVLGLFAEVRCREVGPEELARFGRPGRDPLLNLNTPEDLARARDAL
jgi:molybdopterin-guanine dinucleotide biosynthesis protein A